MKGPKGLTDGFYGFLMSRKRSIFVIDSYLNDRDRAASFRVEGAKEECVKENLEGGGPGGGMLVDFYSISLK